MQQIKIGNKIIDIISCIGAYRNLLGSKRNSIEIILESDYETVKNTFLDNMTYCIVETREEVQEDGTVQTITEEFDKSNYCLSCDITDHRDGTISVFMGELTSEEELLIQLYSVGVC